MKIVKSKRALKITVTLAISFVVMFFTIELNNINRTLKSSAIPFSFSFLDDFEKVIYDLNYELKFRIDESSIFKNENEKIKFDHIKEKRIILVDIDESSLSKLGSYNRWTRDYHAEVIDQLSRGGAASISLDILFKDANFGENASLRALKVLNQKFPNQNWEQDKDKLKSGFNDDSIFVQKVKDSKITIPGATFGTRNDYYNNEAAWRPLSTEEWRKKIAPNSGAPDIYPNFKTVYFEILDNIFPELANAGARMGMVNVIADKDGIHRSEPMLYGYPLKSTTPDGTPHLYPALSLQTVLFLTGHQTKDIKVVPDHYLDIGKPLGVFKDAQGKLQTTYPHLSWDALQALIDKKNEIQNLIKASDSAKKVIDITPILVFGKDENNQKYADILDGQTLDSEQLEALKIKDTTNVWPQVALRQSIKLNSKISLIWNEDESHWFFSGSQDDEVYLDDWSLKQIIKNSDKIDSLKINDRKIISISLDLSWNREKNQLYSKIIILQPSVIRDLLSPLAEKVAQLKNNGDTLRFGDPIHIPIDHEGRMWLNYLSRTGSENNNSRMAFDKKSYDDLVQHKEDVNAFQGQVFILGSTAAALFDQVSAPAMENYPGVFIHMTMISNILNNDFMQWADDKYANICLIIIVFIVAITTGVFSPFIGIIAFILLSFGWFLFNFNSFNNGVYIGVVKPIFAMGITLIFGFVFRYLFEEREKKQAVEMFKNYVSPEMIDELLATGERPELGGEKQFLSAYFTDIAGFSTFSEQIGDAARLVELLNEYLSAMTDILTHLKGTLDKYEGDAIIAFFGAPKRIPNHAYAACETAIGMQKKLAELRIKWESEGNKWPKIVHQMRMRIGINSGDIVTGNMGSKLRMNYTMMGDPVNLAARLESAAKQYGIYIQVSRETYEAAGGSEKLVARFIDRIQVVGKNDSVETFEIIDLKEFETPEMRTLVELFERAWKLYEAQNWDEAIALFKQCLPLEHNHPERAPGCKTTPSHVYIERCEYFKQHPPVEAGAVWDGVYKATEK